MILQNLIVFFKNTPVDQILSSMIHCASNMAQLEGRKVRDERKLLELNLDLL